MGETVFLSVHLTRENELLHSLWHMIMTMNDDDGDDGKKTMRMVMMMMILVLKV